MTRRQFAYHLLDVFTEQPLSGNPLAVVLGAESLDTPAMQAIAREFNLSETVFVLPPRLAQADARLRIFTPARELPFAGHPTIGTACLLGELNPELCRDDRPMILEEGVGPIQVQVRSAPDRAAYARFTVAQAPQIRPLPVGSDELASTFGLNPAEFQASSPTAPLVAASCGLEFVLLPLRSVEALGRVAFSGALAADLRQRLGCDSFYLYHLDAGSSAIHARMFSAGLGVVEDPATGSAAAALAAYLAQRSPQASASLRWSIRQGVEMQRPSQLDVEVDKQQHTLTAVRVGGHALRIASGQLHL